MSSGHCVLFDEVWKEDAGDSMVVRMWLLIFQLLGLNASMIQTCSRILTLLSVACDDFAVYFFTFVITHVIFSL